MRIGVAVKDGIVALSGRLASDAEKLLAERCAQRVPGVRALAVQIDDGLDPVQIPDAVERRLLLDV